MAGSPTSSASAAEATDGPVLSVVSMRLRALRKKYNRILQMEESFAAGKTLNREQEEVLRSKPVVSALIDELERLRAPLLVETDLDAVSALASLAAARPAAAAGVSHRDALQACAHHALLWLRRTDEPIHPDSGITYSGVRAKLDRIMASDYYTAQPEMRATVDVAATVGKYGAGDVQAQESMVVSPEASAPEESLPAEGHKEVPKHILLAIPKEASIISRRRGQLVMLARCAKFKMQMMSGIGYALAKEFLKAGDNVIICSRSAERVASAVRDLKKEFGEQHVWGTVCDVREGKDVKALVDFARDKLKYIDIWINNAGSNAYSHKPLVESSDEALMEVITTNTLGLMICCREALNMMRNQPRGGHIFNIDGAGSDGRPTPR